MLQFGAGVVQRVTVNSGEMVSRNRGQNVAQGDEDFIDYKEI